MRGCIRTTVHHGAMAAATSASPSAPRRSPRCAPPSRSKRVFACTRKERQISRGGTPFLTLELRDSTGSIVGARVSRRRRPRGPFRARRARPRAPGAWRAFASSSRSRSTRSPAPRATTPTLRRFLPSCLPRPRRARGLPRAPRARGLRPGLRGLLDRLMADTTLRAGAAPGALLAACRARRAGGSRPAPITPTWRTARAHRRGRHVAIELCTLHPRIDRDLLLAAAIVHDLGKTREFTYGAEIERSREGAPARPRRARAAADRRRTRRRRSRPSAGSRSSTACSATTAPSRRRGPRPASAEAIALYRLNALDAQVKGAVEHGLAKSPR